MRVTINVLHREALYMLKDKGYKDVLSECDGKSVVIWFKTYLTNENEYVLGIEKINGCYVYSLVTPENSYELESEHNFLANLRLFIERCL